MVVFCFQGSDKDLIIVSIGSIAAGSYVFEARSVVDHSVFLRSNPITVNPPPMRNSEIGKVFQDLEAMLQFDI